MEADDPWGKLIEHGDDDRYVSIWDVLNLLHEEVISPTEVQLRYWERAICELRGSAITDDPLYETLLESARGKWKVRSVELVEALLSIFIAEMAPFLQGTDGSDESCNELYLQQQAALRRLTRDVLYILNTQGDLEG